jgi:hypothetical protein
MVERVRLTADELRKLKIATGRAERREERQAEWDRELARIAEEKRAQKEREEQRKREVALYRQQRDAARRQRRRQEEHEADVLRAKWESRFGSYD